MTWKKAIGFGFLIWVLMFAIVSVFVAFNIYGFVWMEIITAVIAGVTSFILAGLIKPPKASLALTYGAIWVVIGVVLDAIVTVRFNAAIFASWSLWLGYVLILLAPLLQVKKVPAAPKTPMAPPPPPQAPPSPPSA